MNAVIPPCQPGPLSSHVNKITDSSSWFLFSPFYFFGCAQHVGSQFPDQGLNLCPQQWKVCVLITAPPGKLLFFCAQKGPHTSSSLSHPWYIVSYLANAPPWLSGRQMSEATTGNLTANSLVPVGSLVPLLTRRISHHYSYPCFSRGRKAFCKDHSYLISSAQSNKQA